MLLASGNIVNTIRQTGDIDVDLIPSNVMVVTSILKYLVEKQEKASTGLAKTTFGESFIQDHIRYLRWAGIQVHDGKQNDLLDFFISGIVPTLLYHEINFQLEMDISMECSSCKEISRTDRQTWDYLLVPQISFEDSLENIVADLFGRTLQKRICPKCMNDNNYYSSLSLMNCPKNLFLRFDPITEVGNKRHKLMAHMNLAKTMSNKVIFTRSYTNYTLQSFIAFYGKDNNGHFVTFARKQGEWYRLDDMNITLVRSSSIFGDQAENQPVLLAHYTRPSDTDVFSIALWNVFTNFASSTLTLPPALSLNDAIIQFGKHNVIENNPLNLVVIKSFKCSNCKTGMFDRSSLSCQYC
jgi:Ubiquitin carboxyl-terminal hydrolase